MICITKRVLKHLGARYFIKAPIVCWCDAGYQTSTNYMRVHMYVFAYDRVQAASVV